MQRGDSPLLPVPAVAGSFRVADALTAASPLCSDPGEMFPGAVILPRERNGHRGADAGWRLDKDPSVLCGQWESQLLLTPELYPEAPEPGQDGERQLGLGGSGMVEWPLAAAGQDMPGSSRGHHPARDRSEHGFQPHAQFCTCWALTAAPLPPWGFTFPKSTPCLPKDLPSRR